MALVNVAKKIEKKRDELGLGENERVLAACTTNPKGTMKRLAIGGAVGAIVAHRAGGRGDNADTGLAERYADHQSFLVVTDQRLLQIGVSTLTGKPKQVSGQWQRSEIAQIAVEDGRLAYPMTITFVDGSGVQVEGARGTNPSALAEVIGTN